MQDSFTLRFGARVAERLEPLMETFGESTPESLVSLALGLLAAVEPYLEDGILTVLDPRAPETAGDDRFIDLAVTREGRVAAAHAA